MGDKSEIEWLAGNDGSAGATWNPTRGCSKVSPGCKNCYAMRVAHRFSGPGLPYEGLVELRKSGPEWTGVVRTYDEHMLKPLSWKKPRRIFVDSMSDLFHESVSERDIEAVFGVMAMAPQHTFIVLTKRAARMRALVARMTHERCAAEITHRMDSVGRRTFNRTVRGLERGWPWPLPNVILGVSAENQESLDERVFDLVMTPAWRRMVSVEPQLGPINMGLLGTLPKDLGLGYTALAHHLHWVVCGGESGDGARPFALAWARALRDECNDAQVAFFMKQTGKLFVAPETFTWQSDSTSSALGSREHHRLCAPGRRLAAEIWVDGFSKMATWHTWDVNGTGGENCIDPNVAVAKKSVVDALRRQALRAPEQWHAIRPLGGKGGEPAEWPEDLRVRQWPEAA